MEETLNQPHSAPQLYPQLPVLLVDDDPSILGLFKLALQQKGISNVIACEDSRQVPAIFKTQNIGVMLLDLLMPELSGEELLSTIASDHPDVPVIVITGMSDLDMAVDCMRTGAFDYMVKPVESSRLVSGVQRAIEFRELQAENALLKKHMLSGELEYPDAFADIVTGDSHMRSLFRYVETIATTSKPVLITGETGVGKELFAKIVHMLSGRNGPFLAVNAAGLDDTMFSDTLFGHVNGAFTGATEERVGLVEQATAGTLFLDEIGDLSPQSQVKLLRLLQEKEYFPIGGDIAKRAEVRIVVATNHEPQSLSGSGRFRKDLYYRLSTYHVHIPPLRARTGDVPILLDHFLGKAAETLNKKKPTAPKELAVLLSSYEFPGNVRELESLVFEAVSLHTSKMLSMEPFKAYMSNRRFSSDTDENTAADSGAISRSFPGKLPTLRESADALIEEALARSKGNQSIAAQLLGISGAALSKRLKRTRDRDDGDPA